MGKRARRGAEGGRNGALSRRQALIAWGFCLPFVLVFGIDGSDWLHDTRFALPALMIMTIWRNMGTLMIIFLAGLQAIPTELKEAAAVDGAGKWRTFTSITLPLIRRARCRPTRTPNAR